MYFPGPRFCSRWAPALGLALVAALLPASRVLAEPGPSFEDREEWAFEAIDSTEAGLELLSPSASTSWTAGELATLDWRLLPRSPLAPGLEEWEAFLSLDGGETFPYRLTPHLDARRRHFEFRVPATASTHARLLLRFGNERYERTVLVPWSFTIEPALTPSSEEAEAVAVAENGEPALPGFQGVVGWAVGENDGSALRWVEYRRPASCLPAVLPAEASEPEPALPPERVDRLASGVLAKSPAPLPSAEASAAERTHAAAGTGPGPRLGTCRNNE